MSSSPSLGNLSLRVATPSPKPTRPSGPANSSEMVVIHTEELAHPHDYDHDHDHDDPHPDDHEAVPLQIQISQQQASKGSGQYHDWDHLNGVSGALTKEASYRQDLSSLYRHEIAPVAAAAAAAVAAAVAKDTNQSSSEAAAAAAAAAASVKTSPASPQQPAALTPKPSGGAAELRIFKVVTETAESLVSGAEHKTKMSLDRRMLFSFLAGIFVTYGGTLAIMVARGSLTMDLGIQKLLFGACFHVALVMIVLFGAELFTGNCMGLTLGFLGGNLTWKDYFKGLLISYFFNLAGCLFGVAFFVYYAEIFHAEPWLSAVKAIAEKKVHLAPHVVFLRAIPANWLVCMAVFMATSADSIEGKVIACFLPVMTFAAISYEHSIANMFFIPLGIMYGADITVAQFIVHNLLLSTLGNFIGGAIGMACPIYYLFLRKGSVLDYFQKKKN